MRSTSELRFQIKNHPAGGPRDGPIYLCVPNKDLADYFAVGPAGWPQPARRALHKIIGCAQDEGVEMSLQLW